MSNGRRRRLSIALLVLCLLMIVFIGAQMWSSLRLQRVIEYGGPLVTQPEQTELCPGEDLRYHQTIRITNTAMVTISRDWCVRDGVCALDLHQNWQDVILTPLLFDGVVARPIPVSPLFKPGGEYELRTGVRNGELDVQIIPFRIRTDCNGGT